MGREPLAALGPQASALPGQTAHGRRGSARDRAHRPAPRALLPDRNVRLSAACDGIACVARRMPDRCAGGLRPRPAAAMAGAAAVLPLCCPHVAQVTLRLSPRYNAGYPG